MRLMAIGRAKRRSSRCGREGNDERRSSSRQPSTSCLLRWMGQECVIMRVECRAHVQQWRAEEFIPLGFCECFES